MIRRKANHHKFSGQKIKYDTTTDVTRVN